MREENVEKVVLKVIESDVPEHRDVTLIFHGGENVVEPWPTAHEPEEEATDDVDMGINDLVCYDEDALRKLATTCDEGEYAKRVDEVLASVRRHMVGRYADLVASGREA